MATDTPDLSNFRAFFLEEYEARAKEIEATEVIPADLIDRVAEIGGFKLTIPPEWGGLGMSTLEALPFIEASAMGPASGRMLVHIGNGLWRPLLRFGNPAQREVVRKMAIGDACVAFAHTEQSGGPGRDLHSRAAWSDSGWLVTGEKHLITFADRADWFILFAATDDLRTSNSMSAFLIPSDQPGLEVDATQYCMGLHGNGHAWLRFADMPVSDELRLGEVGQGQEIVRSFLTYSILSLTTCMVGLSQRALDEAVAYARRRNTFGKLIAERQIIQAHLADMEADVIAGRSLVRALAAGYDAGGDMEAFAAAVKFFCLNMVGRVTDVSLRVHGGYGYTKDAPIERIYRDARGFWFEEGSQEIQQLIVARNVLSRS